MRRRINITHRCDVTRAKQARMSKSCQLSDNYIWNYILVRKRVACLHPVALVVLNGIVVRWSMECVC